MSPERTPLVIAYSEQYLKWHLTAVSVAQRARIATELLQQEFGDRVTVVTPVASEQTRLAVESVHDARYVSNVVDNARSGEWPGEDPDNVLTALTMFEGTRMLLPLLLDGTAKVVFNPQGAKHHAQYEYSSGFCVFNDMAWVARELQAHGLKPVYLDWDAHAGDGVHHLLWDTDIPTLSIHNGAIFPSDPQMADLSKSNVSHTVHHPDHHAYSWALAPGSGDEELLRAVTEALDVAAKYEPDVVLLATGADGHRTDPLGDLQFDYPGYVSAARLVGAFANTFTQSRVLIGGAGGYQPDDHTPRVWSTVVSEIYRECVESAI